MLNVDSLSTATRVAPAFKVAKQFSRAYAYFTISFKLFMIWCLFFARVKVNHRRVYSHIMVKVCAKKINLDLYTNQNFQGYAVGWKK